MTLLAPNVFYFSVPLAFSCHWAVCLRIMSHRVVISASLLSKRSGFWYEDNMPRAFPKNALSVFYFHYFLSHTLQVKVYLNNHQTLLNGNVFAVWTWSCTHVHLSEPCPGSWSWIDVECLVSCASSCPWLPHLSPSSSYCDKNLCQKDTCIGCVCL